MCGPWCKNKAATSWLGRFVKDFQLTEPRLSVSTRGVKKTSDFVRIKHSNSKSPLIESCINCFTQKLLPIQRYSERSPHQWLKSFTILPYLSIDGSKTLLSLNQICIAITVIRSAINASYPFPRHRNRSRDGNQNRIFEPWCGLIPSFHETKACITQESRLPKSAMQAFRLLKESPAAQTVVASIACDPNVWTAVMQNPILVEYLESEKKATLFESPEFENQESPKSSVNSPDYDDNEKPDGLMALLENVKLTVVDMVQNLTDMVQSWFAVPEADKRAGYTDDSSRTYLAGGSFMALAMMVIMVVVMKRG